MDKKQIRQIVKTARQTRALKDVKRTGWVLKGIKEVESVADHTWLMSVLILLLAPKELDLEKLLKMNAIHDLGEIIPGDVKWEVGKKVIASQEEKRKAEMEVTKKMFAGISGKKEYLALLDEFNQQKTAEAKFLKQIDKIEMAFQALDYQEKGYSRKKLKEFWENVEKYVEGKELEPVFRELQRLQKRLR